MEQNGEALSGSEYSLCGQRARESGYEVYSLISVQRIAAGVEDPVVLFRSLPHMNDVTTQTITYNQLLITDYRSGQSTLKALYNMSHLP